MRVVHGFLLAALLLVVGFVTAAFMHDEGMDGLISDLLGEPKLEAEPAAKPTHRKPNLGLAEAAKELAKGDRAYDAGNFGGAVSAYAKAYDIFTAGPGKARAGDGLEKAVLAQALAASAPRPETPRDQMAGELAKRIAAVEARPSEVAWFDVMRYAAGARLDDQVPYLVDRCLDAALAGGPSEARIIEHLRVDQSNAKVAVRAMKARGLASELPDPDTVSGDVVPFDPDDDEPSGIGGVGKRGTRAPFGAFDAAMRKRLKRAVELLDLGTDEYKLTQPDMPDRNEHRKKALEYLREARDIYQDALEMDPDSDGAQKQLGDVMFLIANINKDIAPIDR